MQKFNDSGKSIVYSLADKHGENIVGIRYLYLRTKKNRFLNFILHSSLTTESSLWVLAYSNWMKIKQFQLEIKQWVHTCLNFNRLEGILDVSVDGSEVKTFHVENTTGAAPETFNLTVGKVQTGFAYFHHPFGGLVTNINMFNSSSDHDLRNMSANPCLYAPQGDFLSWDDITWERDGETVEEITLDEEDEDICSREKFYNVPLPSEYKWDTADSACSVLGAGSIPQLRNTREMEKLIQLTAPCKFTWTPYSDEMEEDSFVNIYTGQPLPALPWKEGNPNLGRAGNGVLLFSGENGTSGLADAASYRSACAACNISKVGKIYISLTICLSVFH